MSATQTSQSVFFDIDDRGHIRSDARVALHSDEAHLVAKGATILPNAIRAAVRVG